MTVGKQGGQGCKETLIEAGTSFKGSFASDCPIVVKGRIEGDLSGPSLTVSSTGSVSGTVKVKELRSEGELSGEYDAEVVQLSGTVKDNTVIRAKHLEVKLNPERGRLQVVFGECELEVGDVPSKDESLAELAAQAAKEAEVESPGPKTDPPPSEAAAAPAPDNGKRGGRKTSVAPPAE